MNRAVINEYSKFLFNILFVIINGIIKCKISCWFNL